MDRRAESEDRQCVEGNSSENSEWEVRTPMEGEGEDSGVKYTFRLEKTEWFASYECRVHRKLLDSGPMDMFTKWFEVWNRKWRIWLKRTDDDHLGVCLYSGEDQSETTVHYSFTVINYKNKKENASNGGISLLVWWTLFDASLTSLTDPHGGFLVEGFFTIQLNMRIKHPENEWHSVQADDRSATFTWKLKDLSAGTPSTLRGDDFSIGNTKWCLQLYPSGDKPGTEKVSIYVKSLNESPVKAEYSLTMINHQSSDSVSKESGEQEFPPQQGRGYRNFIDGEVLRSQNRGFLLEDWIVIVARITLKNEAPFKCIYCLNADQTSGIRHGHKKHVCLCAPCVEILKKKKHTRCLICTDDLKEGELQFF